MLKVLYLLYDNFISNSALHVHNFANAMVERGHECVVMVPDDKVSAKKYMEGDILYTPREFKEIDCPDSLFSSNKEPDIIHAWTPRDIVRKQYLKCKTIFPGSRLIVHLEDNETVLLQRITGFPVFFLKMLPELLMKRVISELMPHPRHYRRFIRQANGITIIMDTLREFVSTGQPHLILWPIIDPKRFHREKTNPDLKKKLGITDRDFILAYTGNVHPSNADEVRTLYMAVGMANKNGIPTRLIRTGTDVCRFLKDEDEWVKRYAIELGFVDRTDFFSYLKLADILIQPGNPGRFNDYRLPSKIPEFLATGKPVAVPRTNIGRFLKDKQEAIILRQGDMYEIATVIKLLREDKQLAEQLSKCGRQFVIDHFNKNKIAVDLENFYNRISNH